MVPKLGDGSILTVILCGCVFKPFGLADRDRAAVEVGEPMPDNAVLIVDDYQHRYYPPYRHVEK